MEDNKNGIPWWAWFVIPASGILLWKMFHNTSRSANRLTEDITDSEAQAAKFYAYFGVHTVFNVPYSTPVVLDSTKRQIGWLARNINDWTVVQRAFTTLCGGNYTLIDAAKNALSTSDFTVFISLVQNALQQPRIFSTADSAHSLYNANHYGGLLGETFAKNAFVGRCISQDADYYYYISWVDGVQYAAPKDEFKLV